MNLLIKNGRKKYRTFWLINKHISHLFIMRFIHLAYH